MESSDSDLYAVLNHPIEFHVQQDDSASHWILPRRNREFINQTERTLCPTKSGNIKVIVSTRNKKSQKFELTFRLQPFELKVGDIPLSNVTFDAFSRKVFYYQFFDNTEEVVIRVKNESTAVCGVLAVEPADSCIDLDLPESTADLRGGRGGMRYFTFLENGAMSLKKYDNKRGFIITILYPNNPDTCFFLDPSKHGPYHRNDGGGILSISIEIKPDYKLASTMAVLGISLALVLAAGGSSYCCYKYKVHDEVESLPLEEIKCGDSMLDRLIQAEYAETDSQQNKKNYIEYGIKIQGPEEGPEQWMMFDKVATMSLRTGSNPSVADFSLMVSDTSIFNRYMRRENKKYFYLIVLMGVFYTLPVVQLVFKNQQDSFALGDLDICYFNFECQYQFGYILDYGHVLSNMGYVIFGLAFTVIVYFRNMNQNKHEEKIAKHVSNNNVNTGIPEEYELFYAMAASSIGEGVLSACYHVCPTGVNFQFDTTFMYIMSVLIFLKVFQFRHSDLTPSPHATYLFISFILVVEVTGYFAYETIAYWTIFTFCYLFIVYYVIMNFSSNKGSKGIFRFLYDTIEIVWHPEEWSLACLQIKPIKLVFLVNICLAGYFLSQARIMYQASTYILLILMLNMQMYFLYYIYCKHWYYYKEKMEGESIKWFTWLYGALAVVCCVFAGIYFLDIQSSSLETPALSRSLNRKCQIGIFDNHDIWHFLSSAGIFFIFMFILTVEDNNVRIPRNKIPVF